MANACRDHVVGRGALLAALTVTFVAAIASESTTARGLKVNGAQATPRANTVLRFDVASIKRNTSAEPGSMIRPEPGGRFVATNVTARMLLQMAFGDRSVNGLAFDFQIEGGPRWVASDRFDIQAKADRELSNEERRAAILQLLEERFQLKTHPESRDIPIYVLIIDKNGSKLKAVDASPSPVSGQSAEAAATPPRIAPGERVPADFRPPAGRVWGGSGALIGSAVPIAQLIERLSVRLSRPVVDRTGLTGLFDFRLEFADETAGPVGAADASGPSLFTALQEQLGLHLDATRGPMPVHVVDRIQRPTTD